MPDGLEQQLPKQDLADLIAYLRMVATPPAAPDRRDQPAGSLQRIKNVILSYPTPDGDTGPAAAPLNAGCAFASGAPPELPTMATRRPPGV